ncbi:FliM/FliN family flagellar motor switch protein, partial [Rhodovulum imhoffii]
MTGRTHQQILRAKAGAGRPERSDLPVAALARALERGAKALFGLELGVSDKQISVQTPESLARLVPETALMFEVEGGEAGIGLAGMSADLALALIEQRLTGGLGTTTAPRRSTRVETALLREGLTPLLCELSPVLRCGPVVETPRLLPMLMGEARLRLLEFGVSIALGQRRGVLWLAVPMAGRPALRRDDRRGEWRMLMRNNLNAAPMACKAILWRGTLPLAQLRGLDVGDLVPVPARALQAVRLETVERTLLATGRLGQSQGQKAIRLDAGGGMAAQVPEPAAQGVVGELAFAEEG